MACGVVPDMHPFVSAHMHGFVSAMTVTLAYVERVCVRACVRVGACMCTRASVWDS